MTLFKKFALPAEPLSESFPICNTTMMNMSCKAKTRFLFSPMALPNLNTNRRKSSEQIGWKICSPTILPHRKNSCKTLISPSNNLLAMPPNLTTSLPWPLKFYKDLWNRQVKASAGPRRDYCSLSLAAPVKQSTKMTIAVLDNKDLLDSKSPCSLPPKLASDMIELTRVESSSQ